MELARLNLTESHQDDVIIMQGDAERIRKELLKEDGDGLAGEVRALTAAACTVGILAAGTAIMMYILSKRNGEARFRQALANENKKAEGRHWVALIIRLLKEKGVESVSFDRSSYDSALGKEELPWCHRWDSFIEAVRLSEYDGNAIVMEVIYKDGPMASSFDGTETEENYEHLFFDIYDELRDPETEPEPEDWIETINRIEISKVLTDVLRGRQGIVDASYDAGSDTLTVTVAKGRLDFKGGLTGATAERYHLFPDLGYFRATFENAKGKPRKSCGMFNGNTKIHPDIASEGDRLEGETPWLNRILGECDWAGYTPAHIDIVEA